MSPQFLSRLYGWIQDDEIIKFYKTKEWKHIRLERMKLDNYECQSCKAKGKYHKAEMVHHIEHVKVRPMLALTMSNLVSLCNQCHNREHPEKLKLFEKKFVNEEKW